MSRTEETQRAAGTNSSSFTSTLKDTTGKIIRPMGCFVCRIFTVYKVAISPKTSLPPTANRDHRPGNNLRHFPGDLVEEEG